MANLSAVHLNSRRTFWIQWALASAVGFGFGASLFGTLAAQGGDGSPAERIGLVLWALLFGFPQWLVLRQVIRNVGWWALTPLAGLLIGSILGFRLGPILGNRIGGPPADFIVSILLTFALSGAISGLLQWMLLKMKGLDPFVWIFVNVIGWLAASVVSVALAFALGMDAEMLSRGVLPFFIQVSLIGAAGGGVLGILTGVVLYRSLGMT
jgi:hypothetical protein